MDLSGLAHLKHLVINSTPIKTLDLPANKQLESLEVNDTLLRDLNVGGLKKLKSLSLKTINTTPGVSGEDLLFDAWVNCVGFKHTDIYLTFAIDERREGLADGAVAPEFVDLTYADYAQPLTVQGLEELDLDVLQICKIPLMGRPTLSAKREMRVYHAGDVEINASSNELEILHIEGANSLTQFTVPAAPNLRDLKLKENGMTMLEFSLSNYPVLKTLNLSDNQLTQFNPSVKFPELTHVALSNNKLSQGNHIDSDKKLEYLLINSAFTDAEKGPLSHWLTLYTPKIEHLEVFDTPINQVAGMEVNQVACEEKLLDVNCAQYGVGAFGDGNLDETFWRAHTANSEY